MNIMTECVRMCARIGASVCLMSNGWFCVTRETSEVYYERLSELYSDLCADRLNDYLLCVC